MPASRHVLACATVMEEMLPLLSADMSYQVLDFGLHINPPKLKQALQDAIDAAAETVDTVTVSVTKPTKHPQCARRHGRSP